MSVHPNSTVYMEMLSRDNYDTWKIHMKAVLIKNSVWKYVDGTKVKPEPGENNATDIEDWVDCDSKAMSDILLAIKPSQSKQVKDCKTSREVWLKLEGIYASSGPARMATYLKQLVLRRI